MQHFLLDDDESPAAGCSRPDLLAPVSGPQERVLRHTVEQLADRVPVVPLLDALVPKMVDQLVGVLKFFDKSMAEQVTEVPKIALQDGVPHHAALREPQLAEELVEVPVPPFRECAIAPAELGEAIMALTRSAADCTWFQVPGSWEVCWWQSGTRHSQWASLEAITRQPRAVFKYWARMTWSTS